MQTGPETGRTGEIREETSEEDGDKNRDKKKRCRTEMEKRQKQRPGNAGEKDRTVEQGGKAPGITGHTSDS